MTKKILVTGMNTLQCKEDFFLKQQLKVVPSHYSLLRCLRDMGYEVEQREVMLGEDISHYDDVIFYIHSPQAFCQAIYTGTYALSQRPDAIIAFDDWQIDQIYGGIRGFNSNLEADDDSAYREYLMELQITKYPVEELKKWKSNFKAGCDIILAKKNRLLVSAFAKGDLSLLDLKWEGQVFRYNPNPYHLNRTPENNFHSGTASIFSMDVDPSEKLKQWNFASLVHKKTKKWLKNQNVSWPINSYGARAKAENSERITEDKMCQKYAEQWGCLMPGYFHSGSGWWRARPLQVADAGSILIGDPKELYVYYQDDALSDIKADEVERMDLTQLTQFAQYQKEALYYNHPLDKTVQYHEIDDILEAGR